MRGGSRKVKGKKAARGRDIGACPGCGGALAVCAEPPAVIHEQPACERFLRCEPDVFLAWVNQKRLAAPEECECPSCTARRQYVARLKVLVSQGDEWAAFLLCIHDVPPAVSVLLGATALFYDQPISLA